MNINIEACVTRPVPPWTRTFFQLSLCVIAAGFARSVIFSLAHRAERGHPVSRVSFEVVWRRLVEILSGLRH